MKGQMEGGEGERDREGKCLLDSDHLEEGQFPMKTRSLTNHVSIELCVGGGPKHLGDEVSRQLLPAHSTIRKPFSARRGRGRVQIHRVAKRETSTGIENGEWRVGIGIQT